MKAKVLLACIAILLIGHPVSAQEAATRAADTPRRTPTLTVNGDGEVSAAPDRATVRLGATAQESEAAAAQSAVNAVLEKALAAIEKAGVPRKSIRTTGLTLSPVYAPQKPSSPETPRVVAYRAGNTIEITLDDVKLVGPVIDAGVTSGANRLEGVSFRLKNDVKERSEALSLAVNEARAKARTMAQALDVKLGKVAEVTEGGVHVMPREETFAAARTFADGARTPVEPGQVRIRASVTIRYEIESR